MCRFEIKSLLLLASAFPQIVAAQGNFNALNFQSYPSGGVYSQNIVGYYHGAVGWQFVPNADLMVTAISSVAPQVNFWSATNQLMANFSFFGSPTNFQSIAPLLLSAGQSYFITCQYSNFANAVTFYVLQRDQTNGFTVSEQISQFGSYTVSTTGQWLPSTDPASENANYLFGGPNFQFQVVPEPTILSLLVIGLAALSFHRWKKA